MMKMRTGVILAALAAVLAAMPAPDAIAVPDAPAVAQYTDAQLDQMLAPIALYPDTLLTQVLMAATYPLEIVEADRWVRQPDNAALTGDDLNAALGSEPWDPSVKSLVPFPQILHMMDDKLTWTERLGDAFLADQAAVMASVQRLRRQAQAAGNLRSTTYETVEAEGSQIVIVPAEPDIVYVPVYDPVFVYGPWPYPAYPPFYFGAYFDVVFVGGFGWAGFSVVRPLWGWCDWDWRRSVVFVNPIRFNDINVGAPPIVGDRWHHDPFHRHGVPYPNEMLRERFQARGAAADMRRFRGYPQSEGPASPPAFEQRREQRPEQRREQPREQPRFSAGERERDAERQQPQAAPGYRASTPEARPFERRFEAARPGAAPPPAFESYGRSAGEIRMQSERGYASRHSMPVPGGGGARSLRQQGFGPPGGSQGGFGGGQGGEGGFGGRGRR
jgi:hypothetical protein